jgi:predicted RNA-binding Zn-ribbon protein involved in translation (DUF1610 family)
MRHRVPMAYRDPHHHQPRREFHRYCVQCGGGFSMYAWYTWHCCPVCGTRLPANRDRRNPGHRTPSGSRYGRYNRNGNAQPGRPRPAYARPKSESSPYRPTRKAPEPARNDHRVSDREPAIGRCTRIEKPAHLVVQAGQWVRVNPITSGVAAAAAGVGMIVAAPSMIAAGAAVIAFGASIATFCSILGGLGAFLGALGGKPELAVSGVLLALGGLAAGGAVAAVGGLIAATGTVMAVGGAVLAYGGGATVLAAGTMRLHAWEKEHRHLARATASLRSRFADPDQAAPETVSVSLGSLTDRRQSA